MKEMAKNMAEYFGLAFLAEPWVLQVLIVVTVVVAINLFVGFVLHRAEKIALSTTNVWDDALIRAARRPLGVALWIIAKGVRSCIVHSGLRARPIQHALMHDARPDPDA